MKRFLPAKRAMLMFYLLIAAAGAALNVVIYRYVTMLPEELVKMIAAAVWVLILLIAVIVIPHYFLHAKVIITKNEIATSGGFIFLKNDYMPISSIKSVSVIITPLGRFTGFNFAVINALGARILICFMRKSDLTEIAETINALIRSREEPQETQRRAQKTRRQPQKRADDHNHDHEHEQTTNNDNKKSGGAGAV